MMETAIISLQIFTIVSVIWALIGVSVVDPRPIPEHKGKVILLILTILGPGVGGLAVIAAFVIDSFLWVYRKVNLRTPKFLKRYWEWLHES